MKRLILMSACIAAISGAFAQQECVKTAVNLTGNQMTLTSSGAKSVTTTQNFVYYEKKRLRKRDQTFSVPGSTAGMYPSEPLLLKSEQDIAPVQEKYNVSVGLPQRNVTACPDSAVNLAATLNVERVGSFTGNYPVKVAPSYQKVSKRHYKMALRKKKKIERIQEKIARKADVNVEVRSTEAVAWQGSNY